MFSYKSLGFHTNHWVFIQILAKLIEISNFFDLFTFCGFWGKFLAKYTRIGVKKGFREFSGLFA